MRLKLEMTESVLMESGESPIAVLEALKAIGVRVILDDFGTGYSSLSYLERLPLDGLKIDRSFIVGLTEKATSRAIFSAVIDMAAALGLSVVAEGIETSEQMQLVELLGCQHGQGYLFARPSPAAALTELLASGPLAQTATISTALATSTTTPSAASRRKSATSSPTRNGLRLAPTNGAKP